MYMPKLWFEEFLKSGCLHVLKRRTEKRLRQFKPKPTTTPLFFYQCILLSFVLRSVLPVDWIVSELFARVRPLSLGYFSCHRIDQIVSYVSVSLGKIFTDDSFGVFPSSTRWSHNSISPGFRSVPPCTNICRRSLLRPNSSKSRVCPGCLEMSQYGYLRLQVSYSPSTPLEMPRTDRRLTSPLLKRFYALRPLCIVLTKMPIRRKMPDFLHRVDWSSVIILGTWLNPDSKPTTCYIWSLQLRAHWHLWRRVVLGISVQPHPKGMWIEQSFTNPQ